MKRKIILLMAAAVLSAAMSGRTDPVTPTPQERYIARYSSMAVSEMYRSGVPASITLAQGLLESRYGESVLATRGNNHFGIKCGNWTGKTMRHDDDERNECFRAYDGPEESYRDHSDFLRYRDRYKFLFDLDVTDYRGWAYGLKKAGYATDPEYASKLIRLIEDYRLFDYDTPALSGGKPSGSSHEAGRLPAPPLQLEAPQAYAARRGERFHFALSRPIRSLNGVPFIYSLEGETFSSIAESQNLFVKELLKFNDMDAAEDLVPGTVVFLRQKKSKAVKGMDKYIVDHDGESLRDIAQRFAVKLKSLEKMNGISGRTPLREGDMILLRPVGRKK